MSYIGSSGNPRRRFIDHRYRLRHGKHHSIKLQNAWEKYGEEAFTFKIIENVEVDRMPEREQFYIDTVDAVRRGYNVAPLANVFCSTKHSIETRVKIGSGNRGKPRSPEIRAKISASQKGRKLSAGRVDAMREWARKHPLTVERIASLHRGHAKVMIGKPLTQEHRKKISDGLTGKTLSAVVREKISATKKAAGKPLTQEQKDKISASLKGRACSAETRAKIGDANRRPRKPLTQETRDKIRAALIGRPRPKEVLAKIIANKRGVKLIAITPDA